MTSAHSLPVLGLGPWAVYIPPLAGMAVAAVAYGAGVRRLAKPGGTLRPQARHIAAFYAGIACLAAAVASPLDSLAEALFSAHMVQHLLIVLVASALLVYGRPWPPFAMAAPPWMRRWIAGPLKGPAGRRLREISLHPLVVGVVHATVLWVWHLPGPYQAAVNNHGLHALEHGAFLVTALMFWHFVMRAGLPGRLLPATLLVLGTALQSGALGAILTFATFELYPVHASSAAEFGLSPLQDQQLAGAIMWIPAGGVYLMTIVVLLSRAFRDLERRMGAKERTPAEPAIEAGGRS